MKRTSANGRNFITQWEGEILKVYKDPIGLPTVGVGHLVTPMEKGKYPLGKKITREESQALLSKDLILFENVVNAEVKVPITQNQFDALVALSFNIGIGAFRRASLLKKLNNKDYAGAARGFMAWVRAGGGVLKGLVNRRTAEKALFLKPEAKLSLVDDQKPTIVPEPAPPAGNAPTPPAPEPAKPPIDLGALSDKVFERITNTSNKIHEVQAGVSRSEFLTKQASKLGTAVTTALTLLFVEYWFITVPLLLVFLGVAGFLAYRHRGVLLGYKTALSPATEITTLHGN